MIDLDGVMWRGAEPIAGSAATVQRMLDRDDRVVFCTNNSTRSGAAVRSRLIDHGLPAGSEVITSADAVSTLVSAGERVLVLGGGGLIGSIASTGASVRDVADPSTADERFDSVVIGLSRSVDYDRIDRASSAVRNGARLLASNADPTFPAAGGIRPGCGAIVAAVETASGRRAVVAGKPNGPMVDRIRSVFGESADGVVVGDRVDTDGELARRLGWPFGLVMSGVTTAARPAPGVSDVRHRGRPGGARFGHRRADGGPPGRCLAFERATTPRCRDGQAGPGRRTGRGGRPGRRRTGARGWSAGRQSHPPRRCGRAGVGGVPGWPVRQPRRRQARCRDGLAFELDAGGVHALDAGASTGGFTDCLLQRGAQHVVALDVGYNQLHERLRRDERVTVMERTNLRHVDPGVLGTFDAVVADLSFISLRAVAGALVTASAPSGWMVWLAKPQFEVDRAAADRGRGVITDPELWSSALAGVAEAAATAGASVVDAIPSPLRGASGNTEFLLHVRHAAGATNTPATDPRRTLLPCSPAVATASDPEAFGASG